jgi:hypothetical protein
LSAYTSWYYNVSLNHAVSYMTYTIGVDLQFDRVVDTVERDGM